MGILHDLALETRFAELEVGSSTTLLAEVLVYKQGRHLCRSAIHRQLFQCDAIIDPTVPTLTLLDAEFQTKDGHAWLCVTTKTAVIQHAQTDEQSFRRIIETCAGIGGVGQGFSYMNIETVCFAEINSKFCEWLHAKHKNIPIVQGDIYQNDTIKQVAAASGGKTMLSAGFSCQPFSGLGDRREGLDPRSRSLIGALRMGYLLRCPLMILECTREVLSSDWAQSVLRTFCEATGFAQQQQILELHGLLPSIRTRWWAIISLPDIGVTGIPPLPKLDHQPCISDLFQLHHELPEAEMQQLCLDLYEARHFHNAKGGIGAQMINRSRQMPTATHSWGTQLSPCHCGCRASGFSLTRLNDKGLYGVLIPLEKMMDSPHDDLFALRHPHPKEIAILNGLNPSYLDTEETFTLKFLLGGVGQMASPIQGMWVLSNALQQIHHKTGIVPQYIPLKILANMCMDLLDSRFDSWEGQITNEFTNDYKLQFAQMEIAACIMSPDECADLSGVSGTSAAHLPAIAPASDALQVGPCTAETTNRSHLRLKPEPRASDPIAQDIALMHPVGPNQSFPSDAGPTEASRSNLPDLPATPSQNEPPPPPRGFLLGGVEPPSALSTGVEHTEDQAPLPDHDELDSQQPNKRIKINNQSTLPTATSEPYTPKGGLNLFANCGEASGASTATTPVHLLTNKHECPNELPDPAPAEANENPGANEIASPTELTVEPTATWPEYPAEPDVLDLQIAVYADEYVQEKIIVWIGLEGEPLYQVRTDPDATIGQIVQAEVALSQLPAFMKPLSAVGSELSLGDIAVDCQIILVRPIGDDTHSRCPCTGSRFTPPNVVGLPRNVALWNQLGWVAVDEMTFYLSSIHQACNACTTSPLVLAHTPGDSRILGRWIVQACELVSQTEHTKIATACLIDRHWFPILLDFDEDKVHVTVSPEMHSQIQSLIQDAFESEEYPSCIGQVRAQVVPTSFAADCGFQTLAFILHHLRGDQTVPMPPSEAIEWRILFAQHLMNFHRHAEKVSQLELGGTFDHATHAELRKLLEEHGVQQQRSQAAARHLITVLGQVTIASILKSPKPWKDLKARSNQCQPPIQLVLADALQAQIEKRQKEGKSFGSKHTKAKQSKPKQNPLPELLLKADQIKMPDGIWKQEDNTVLKQINTHQVQSRQKGIAVMTLEEAQPYLQLQEPICAEGLAVLILNAKTVALPDKCQQVSFPASYVATQEPMIVTAHLLQLGKQSVSRIMPKNPITVHEVETEVLRCVLYRDQCDCDWQAFARQPVRTILELDGMKDIQTVQVLDVTDRQFLTKTFQKARPDQADLYSVVIRFTKEGAIQARAANARLGLYVEPRAPHGKAPHEDYKVVWLPRTDFNAAVIAQQTTNCPTAIVRSGDRFGLRTSHEHTKEVHAQHRPEVSYLDSSKAKQYKLSPLPYGTTKANLQQVCAEWEWAARPSHSLGNSGENGLAWIVHATEEPKFWMWTMAHGDVLIQEVESAKSHAQGMPSKTIVASHRTLQHITQANGQPSGHAIPSGQDPLTHHDPWKKPGIPSNANAITSAQVAQLEASLAKKIEKALQDRKPTCPAEDADMTMESDVRVTHLEQQVSSLSEGLQKLSANVTQFQQAQQQQNTAFAQQTQGLQTQIEQQGHNMQKVVDQAMEDQMRRIEALFSKDREHAAKVARKGE